MPSKKRLSNGDILFSDYPDFKPNLTPSEVIKMGSFGGTYWRPIKCCVTNKELKNVHKKYPKSWWKGVPDDHMTRDFKDYDPEINKYKVRCGQTYSFWCNKNWITKYNCYGWFHWYCDFYKGRRCPDDERQISRWLGVRSRFGNRLINMLNKKNLNASDVGEVSPKIAQTLQHWGWKIKSHHL